MKNIVLLRPLLVKGILETTNQNKYIDFKTWIASGKFLVNSVNSSSSFELYINDEFHFVEMLSFDSNRMATAGFETIESISFNEKLPKSFGWIAIQAYYAAFFSAHSIMRNFGYSCSQLEKGHIQDINDYATALGMQGSLKKDGGYYRAIYNKNNSTLNIKKMENTHEDTWHTFIECLKYLSINVLLVAGISNDKKALSSEIDQLILDLQHNGQYANGAFLTKFRNAINYRQEYQAWHPYGKSNIQAQAIINLIKNWKNCPLPNPARWKRSPDVFDFFMCCLKIVNLNYVILLMIMSNSTQKKNFYSQWSNSFLKLQNL